MKTKEERNDEWTEVKTDGGKEKDEDCNRKKKGGKKTDWRVSRTIELVGKRGRGGRGKRVGIREFQSGE